MNKKYLLLVGGGLILFIIFVVIGFFQQNSPPKPTELINNRTALQQNDKHSTEPSITLAPPATTPKAAAQQFYEYYFSSDTNPLAAGAFKNNPYLSEDFKGTIADLYNNGNAPILCPQNKRANITVGKETQRYYNNQYLAVEIISDAASGKDLYRMTLENVNGQWLIFDANCIY